MKTVFLFISIMILGFNVRAQENLTHEEGRFICAEMMANFTQSVSGNYKEGMSIDEFRSELCGQWEPVEQGKAQLEAAYAFLEKKATKDEILKTYSGKEIANSLAYLSELHKQGIESDGSELFGGKTESKDGDQVERKCKWYQLWCHVQAFANWLVQNWEQVRIILDYILHGI